MGAVSHTSSVERTTVQVHFTFLHISVHHRYMDLDRLRVLRVLAQKKTVTATAAVLHLTPSAVSQQLRQLSREVGVELLRSQGRNVRLTPAAHTLLGHADRLAEAWEQTRADLVGGTRGTDAGVSGPLRMCGFPSGLGVVVVPAAERLRKTAPELTVRITEAENADCFDLLLADRVDIGVAVAGPGSPPADDPRFCQETVLVEPLDLLVYADHPLAERSGVELAEAAYESWIAPAAGTCDHHDLLVVTCASAGFTPRIEHFAVEWCAITALVAGGFGICLIPRYAPVTAGQHVVRVPLTGRTTPVRHLQAWARRGSTSQPGIAAGLAALHEVGSELSEHGPAPASQESLPSSPVTRDSRSPRGNPSPRG